MRKLGRVIGGYLALIMIYGFVANVIKATIRGLQGTQHTTIIVASGVLGTLLVWYLYRTRPLAGPSGYRSFLRWSGRGIGWALGPTSVLSGTAMLVLQIKWIIDQPPTPSQMYLRIVPIVVAASVVACGALLLGYLLRSRSSSSNIR